MKPSFLRYKDIITGVEIFRLVSPIFYATLLLQLALSSYGQLPVLSDTRSIAGICLIFLFFATLARFFRFKSVTIGLGQVLLEFVVASMIIAVLTLQRTIPALPWPWLVAMGALFPLVVEGWLAVAPLTALAVIGCGLSFAIGMPLGDWLPALFQILLIGMLSILLSRVLLINVSAIRHARTNAARFEAIVHVTQNVFLLTDQHYKPIFINPAIQDMLGYTVEEITQGHVRPKVHPDDLREHQEKLRFLARTSNSSIFTCHRMQHKNGTWLWLETRGYNMMHDAAIHGLVFGTKDVTLRRSAELKLEQERTLMRAVLDHNPSMIYAKDIDGRFTISNLGFQRRFGFSSEDEVRGKTVYEVLLNRVLEGREAKAHEVADKIHQQDMAVIESGEPIEDLESKGFWRQNSQRWYRTNKYPLRDAHGHTVGVLDITSNVTTRKEFELRLQHQALHDPLTGLPNRRYLLEEINDAIEYARGRHQKLALLFCDLDGFKNVNDIHGHEFGDKCLKEITQRIQAQLHPSDFFARFGGDEFVVLTNASVLEANAKAQALLQAMSLPLMVDDVLVKIGSSIGVALLRPEHASPAELIHDADAAMYQAKELGHNRVEIFDSALQSRTTKRAQMDVALRFALERNELTVAYQPKACLQTGRLQGFELLLRWDSPEYGHISPAEFIPIAEHSGLIVSIGLWVLEQACLQFATWQELYPGMGDMTIAVNVSMRQLLHSSFLAEVTRILATSHIRPQSLELELTETAVMANPVQTVENLTMLKKLGLRLALDDFGTGYSSLAYLQRLPIDVLKIDRAFVHGLGQNQGDAAIVRLIVALSKTLHLETIAEGVETLAHVQQLNSLGCNLGQGYAFSPAISADEAEDLLRYPRNFLVA